MKEQLSKFFNLFVDKSDIEGYTLDADFALNDLTDLILIYRKVIFIVTSIIVFLTASYSLSIPRYYESNILMVESGGSSVNIPSVIGGLLGSAGGGGGGDTLTVSAPDLEHALAILRSRQFLEKYIQENNLMPTLMGAEVEEGEGLTDLLVGYKLIEGAMDVQTSGLLIEMTITWGDPRFATTLANGLIERVNEYMRKEALEESSKSIEFLQKELNSKDANTKLILSKLIEKQMQSMVLANVRDEYVFKVVDPAFIPDEAAGPQRRLITAFGGILGFIFSLFISVLHFRFATLPIEK
tara:strand:- start:2879 stop:3769 length:891 start_codon:yes stop_codon:yes gene_type:complete